MSSSSVAAPARKSLVDPLAFLPCSTTAEFRKPQTIFDFGQPCARVYLVLSGAVRVTRLAKHGDHLIVDFYRTDDLFGDLGLLNPNAGNEQAIPHHKATLMSWSTEEIHEIVLRRPELGIALLQTFGTATRGMVDRIESLSCEPFDRRLARALLLFGERIGAKQPDGSVRMDAITHELIAQYVGTSREVVTCHMTQFRRLGFVEYSRKMILVRSSTLKGWLDGDLVAKPMAAAVSASSVDISQFSRDVA